MKHPQDQRDVWDKFFWSDWRSDEGLRLCSFAARGFWMECLALMAKSVTKGHLLVNGVKPDLRTLKTLTGAFSEAEMRRCLEELTRHHVCSLTDDGVMFSRRMVRDAAKRERNRVNGMHGGNPALLDKRPDRSGLTEAVNRSDKPGHKPQKLDATFQKLEDPHTARFARFWAVWPKAKRVAKGRALQSWRKVSPDDALTSTIVEAVERAVATPEWQRERGRFVPHPSRWLDDGRWTDEVAPASLSNGSRPTIHAGLLRICEKAGITSHNTYEWFADAYFNDNESMKKVKIVFPNSDILGYVERHFLPAITATIEKLYPDWTIEISTEAA